MVSWQTAFVSFFVFVLVVFSGFSSVETKKKKKGKYLMPKETLQQVCDSAGQVHSRKNILELQAFFDLRKSFACLKVETCDRVPLCFVEDTPDLGQESLNDCALWNLFLNVLQTQRKIEPVSENSVYAPNGGKSRSENSWDDAVSTLCYGANVYRFVSENTEEDENAVNGTSQSSPTNSTLNHINNATNGSTARPITNSFSSKKRLRRGGALNAVVRRLRRKHVARGNSSCVALDGGCSRICVGQNEQLNNLSECLTFKIRCMIKRSFRNPRKQKGRGRKRNKD